MKHKIIKTYSIFFVLFTFVQCSNFKPSLTGSTLQSSETESDDSHPELVITYSQDMKNLPVTQFPEIWAYVVTGRESALARGLPITDVGYFGSEVDAYGKLIDVPRRQNINFQGRVHLVAACSSRSLTHFVLLEGRPERKALIEDLIAATRPYDGLQIDFEYVPARDGEAYLSFLRELRAGLQGKMLTVALAARTRKIADDVYDYEKILPVVDRILVMAYDEHWSGSDPGSVASIDWCRRVAEYSLRVIGPEKLVMGMPFYGRAWGDYSPSRALVHSTIAGIIKDENVQNVRYENGIPAFTYNKNVSIRVYFEDEFSLSRRMEMYRSMNIRAIGFWRLGQETTEIWRYLKLSQ
ncbi:MAG: glycosyl hydrolase family 18 protein [Treponema sp.]|nr:glycosyl hydrolase family 18 protein [Treponema sp.]MCL2271998.1 glycosyl hydrolase family 18 protein [Treponema sp.]